MKKSMLLVLVVFSVGCKPASPAETVESLAANPARLKELREQCRIERDRVGDELCVRAAEAANRRFLGDGKARYTPPKETPKF